MARDSHTEYERRRRILPVQHVVLSLRPAIALFMLL
jgi:hypothetical protein